MTFLNSIIFFLLCLLTSTGYSQNEANNWIFGVNGGISFQKDKFTPILNTAINSLEGISSISDKNGNLVFYSDGSNVYNRKHQLMPNGSGLLGSWSSTQSSIIVPKPGSSTIYYLFTSDAVIRAQNHFLTDGYRYSEIDMSLDGGFGDVTSNKNIMLYSPCTEKLCAVKHANGIDYWVLTHEWDTNTFRAYLVDCNGVNLNFVFTRVGISVTNYFTGAIGQMKFSPDGKKIIMVMTGLATAQLFDFDNTTGVVSNPQTIKSYWTDGYLQPSGMAFDFENIYGAEFSPNSKVLYLSSIDAPYLFQYNLLNTSDISSTGLMYYVPNVNGASFGTPGGLQLAPDGKIYQASRGFFELNVINKPNNYGPELEYVFSPNIGSNSQYGLPNFAASFFNDKNLTYSITDCKVLFETNATGNVSYHWDFGDPYSETDYSDQKSTSYTYPKAGTYNVKLSITNALGCSETINKTITTNCITNIFIPNLITPNGDNANDKFQIENLNIYPDNHLKIYNRWGDLIYEKKGYQNDWNGEDASDGIYYYELNIQDLKKSYKGVLNIIR